MTPADVFAERLLAKLEERKAELIDFVINGQVPTFDRFCFHRAQISTLDDVMDEIRELLGPMISADPFEGKHDYDLSKGPHGPI